MPLVFDLTEHRKFRYVLRKDFTKRDCRSAPIISVLWVYLYNHYCVTRRSLVAKQLYFFIKMPKKTTCKICAMSVRYLWQLQILVLTGSVDLNFSAQLYKDLKKAEESLVLTSHLHLLFLVTPYDLVKDVQPPWMTYFKQVWGLEERLIIWMLVSCNVC